MFEEKKLDSARIQTSNLGFGFDTPIALPVESRAKL